jgi:hypothetical protein
MKPVFIIVAISVLGVLGYYFLNTPAALSETEMKLYNSCLTSKAPKDLRTESMCQCQARKWGAGTWSSAEGIGNSIEIKKEYVDDLIKNWGNTTLPKGAQVSKMAAGDQEKLGLVMGISFECMQETGVIKPGALDNLKNVSQP